MFKDTGRCTFMARINYVISRANVGGEIVERVGEFRWYMYMFLIVLEDEPPVGLDSIHVLSLSSRYKMCRIVWNVLCVKTYVSISCWMSTTSNFKNFEYLNILLRFPRRWIAKLWSSKDTNFNFGTMSIQTRNTTFFLHSVSKEDPKKIFIVYVTVDKIHIIR